MLLVSLHPLQDRKCRHSSVKLCSKLVGLPAHQLSTMYTQQACALAGHVLTHCTCTLLQAPQLLPSGHRFLRPACQTQRRRATFAPKALSPSKFSGVTWTLGHRHYHNDVERVVFCNILCCCATTLTHDLYVYVTHGH